MELNLTLAAEKTLITHANAGKARFLGYEIGIMDRPNKFDNQDAVVNGKFGLYIPEDVIQPNANDISGTKSRTSP